MLGFRILQVLAFLAIGYILYKIWQKINFILHGSSQQHYSTDNNIEDLVACNWCGLQLPKKLALEHNSVLHFCCQEHKDNFLNSKK